MIDRMIDQMIKIDSTRCRLACTWRCLSQGGSTQTGMCTASLVLDEAIVSCRNDGGEFQGPVAALLPERVTGKGTKDRRGTVRLRRLRLHLRLDLPILTEGPPDSVRGEVPRFRQLRHGSAGPTSW